MVYKIDTYLIEKGMQEVLKAKISILELKMEDIAVSDIQVAVNEYQEARNVAISFLVNTNEYDSILLKKEKELKDRWGIQIKWQEK